MKTALVFGATGLVSKALVEQLAVDSHSKKVISITRRQVEYASAKIVNEVVNFDNIEDYRDVFNGDILF